MEHEKEKTDLKHAADKAATSKRYEIDLKVGDEQGFGGTPFIDGMHSLASPRPRQPEKHQSQQQAAAYRRAGR
jgi:hypothetical protein